MKTNKRFAVTAIGVAFLVCSSFSALAQSGPSPNTPAAGTTAGTARISPLLMATVALNAGITDPSQTSIAQLVMRPDIRTELQINAKQREGLDKLQLQARQQVQTQMLANLQQAQGNPSQPSSNSAVLSTQMQQVLLQTMNTVMANMEQPIEGILTPDQMSRLHQLDLQWRGPLAMAGSTVADALQLTPDQRTFIAQQFQQYEDAQEQLLIAATTAARTMQQSPPNNLNDLIAGLLANPNGGSPGSSPAQNATRTMAKLRVASLLLQRTTANKVLAALSPGQLQAWQVLQGAPFTLRTNL